MYYGMTRFVRAVGLYRALLCHIMAELIETWYARPTIWLGQRSRSHFNVKYEEFPRISYFGTQLYFL